MSDNITVEPTTSPSQEGRIHTRVDVAEPSPYADVLALVTARLKSESWNKVDLIEEAIEQLPEQNMPLLHVFTPGLYARQIFMPRGPEDALGVLVTSRIHLTEHPFIISAGVVSVWDDATGWTTLRAPYIGVTKPGTRRILFIHEDTVWTTFHVTDDTDPDTIVRKLTYSEGRFQELRMAAAKPDDFVIRYNEPEKQLKEASI